MNTCKEESQTFKIQGHKISGKCDSCFAPAVYYLHLTKDRELSDWPEAGDTSGTISNLALKREQTGIISILEYTYLLPVSNTPYIALLRSSSGPTPSVIEKWVSFKESMVEEGSSFELQPILRDNAQQKLNKALGVKSLEVRFEGKPDSNASSVIERAAAEASSSIDSNDYANMSVDFRISMGRPTIVENSTKAIQKQALSILANSNVSKTRPEDPFHHGYVTKMRAKTIQRSPDSDKTIIEPVDFIKEQLTEDIDFGSRKDSEMTPEIILSGMIEAINRFRKRDGEGN